MSHTTVSPAAFARSLSFPKDFHWGTASSSYQVEGGYREGGRTLSIWDTFARTPGKVVRSDNCDITIDEFHRYEANLDMMAAFGMRSYRFSMAWPRIVPDGKGAVNQAGMDYYKRLIDACWKRNITPLVTLFHWDLPQVLEDKGGWLARDTSSYFADYCAAVYKEFAADVPMFMTINEPWCPSWLGYGDGTHAPGKESLQGAFEATHHLLLGHGLAVDAMRASSPQKSDIGIVLNLYPTIPASQSPDDLAAATRLDGVANRLFLDLTLRGEFPADVREWYADKCEFGYIKDGDFARINRPLDFLGLNYYHCHTVEAATDGSQARGYPGLDIRLVIPEGIPTTFQNWPIQPEGMTDMLVRLKDEYTGDMPIFVTENGCSLNDYVDPEGQIGDDDRIAFFSDHIAAIDVAMKKGVPVIGYTPWSFFDCYEWAEGFSRRFGLVYVDYKTQERTPKKSAYWYRDFIEAAC